MTCLRMPPIGYAGQKYEVSCLGFYNDDPEKRKVVGWTNDPTGGGLFRMIKAHPTWNSPEVREVEHASL